jgi:hypothetical protein
MCWHWQCFIRMLLSGKWSAAWVIFQVILFTVWDGKCGWSMFVNIIVCSWYHNLLQFLEPLCSTLGSVDWIFFPCCKHPGYTLHTIPWCPSSPRLHLTTRTLPVVSSLMCLGLLLESKELRESDYCRLNANIQWILIWDISAIILYIDN